MDPVQIAEEQELASDRSLLGQGKDTLGKTGEDLACTTEVLKGLFTGQKPLSCKPGGSLDENWGMYKWALRIGGALLIVGFAGNAVRPYVQMFRKDQ